MNKFAGDKKLPLTSPLAKIERKFIDTNVARFPRWIQGYHLTLMTILWSLGMVMAGYLARGNLQWLWLSSLMLVFQWFTDGFDGALGRLRDTGIPKWGYYMDHFLDYIFLCSVLIGYAFIFNDQYNSLFFILAIFTGFMVNSYLSFAVTNEFKIEYLKIGPTEIRLLFIVINTLLIIFHGTYLVWILPYVLAFSLFGLVLVVYRTQKRIWQIDMTKKNKNADQASN